MLVPWRGATLVFGCNGSSLAIRAHIFRSPLVSQAFSSKSRASLPTAVNQPDLLDQTLKDLGRQLEWGASKKDLLAAQAFLKGQGSSQRCAKLVTSKTAVGLANQIDNPSMRRYDDPTTKEEELAMTVLQLAVTRGVIDQDTLHLAKLAHVAVPKLLNVIRRHGSSPAAGALLHALVADPERLGVAEFAQRQIVIEEGLACLIHFLGRRYWHPTELPRRKEYAVLLTLATDPAPDFPKFLARCGGVRQLLGCSAVWEAYPAVPLMLLLRMANEWPQARQQLLQDPATVPMLAGMLSLRHYLHTRRQAADLLALLLEEDPGLRQRVDLADVAHPASVTPRQWLQWWQWVTKRLGVGPSGEVE